MYSPGGEILKKFEGWRTEELQYVATLLAGREMALQIFHGSTLYDQLIREIRNRRIHDELGQLKLNLEDPDNP
jgi:hypothetical protein